MTQEESDIDRVLHHRDPTVKDAIEYSSKRHTEFEEQEAKARLEALLHRLSDEETERARRERSSHM